MNYSAAECRVQTVWKGGSTSFFPFFLRERVFFFFGKRKNDVQGIWAFSGPRLEPIRVQPIPLLPLQPLCRCPADLASKRRNPRLSSLALGFRLLAHPLSPPRFDSSLLLGFLTPLHRLPWQTKPTERCVPVPGGSRPCHVSLLNFFHFFPCDVSWKFLVLLMCRPSWSCSPGWSIPPRRSSRLPPSSRCLTVW